MAGANIIQFPKHARLIKKRRKACVASPHPDDVLLDDLSALWPEDEELWRSLIHIAADLQRKKGIAYRPDLKKLEGVSFKPVLPRG